MPIKKVMVVDDSPTERAYLENLLKKKGFDVILVDSGEESTKHIPVIICTTKDQETDKIWGLRQGAKDYVTKPINEIDLIDKIKSFG